MTRLPRKFVEIALISRESEYAARHFGSGGFAETLLMSARIAASYNLDILLELEGTARDIL